MLKDITIGQYIPGSSPLHKMHAPIKIILTILYITVLFLVDSPVSYVIFTVYTVALVLISGVPMLSLIHI